MWKSPNKNLGIPLNIELAKVDGMQPNVRETYDLGVTSRWYVRARKGANCVAVATS
jgi:hypothetical protein